MAHQAKRPYAGTRASSQSAITSYFTPSSNTLETDTTKPSAYSLSQQQHTSYTPVLPNSVQSNLLNVGMRVRKSVPEGYKTGSYSAFTLFADTTPASGNTSKMAAPVSPPTKTKTRPRSGNRELTPFCGIMTTGGMAAQQWGIYNPSGSMGEMDEDSTSEDEVPFLSSQGSTISSSSVEASTPGGNKRRFFEDEEETSNIFSNSSPDFSSNTFMNFSSGSGERVLAVPRRKKSAGGKGQRNTSGQVRIFGQENFLDGRSGKGNANGDFEDAEFLDYGLVGEVEMGGCN